MTIRVTRPESILIFSNAHIGAGISNFANYQDDLLKKIRKRNDDKRFELSHVVLNGDIFELFDFESQAGADGKNFKGEVRDRIHQAVEWLDKLISENPHTRFHLITGEHESIQKFHSMLNTLAQKHYGAFEWHTQAIQIGDALFTHGHSIMKNQPPSQQLIYSLDDTKFAATPKSWANAVSAIMPESNKLTDTIQKATKLIYEKLSGWSNSDQIRIRKMGEEETLPLDFEPIEHVFTAASHTKYHNVEHEGKTFHDTGAFIQTNKRDPSQVGVLEAVLQNCKVSAVQEVELAEKKAR